MVDAVILNSEPLYVFLESLLCNFQKENVFWRIIFEYFYPSKKGFLSINNWKNLGRNGGS